MEMMLTCIMAYTSFLKQTEENRIVLVAMSFFRMDLRINSSIPLPLIHLREAARPYRFERSVHRVLCDQSNDLSVMHALSRQLSRSDRTELLVVEEHRVDLQSDSTNTRRQ